MVIVTASCDVDHEDPPRSGLEIAAIHELGYADAAVCHRNFSPHFLFEVGVSDRMIEPAPVFMRL